MATTPPQMSLPVQEMHEKYKIRPQTKRMWWNPQRKLCKKLLQGSCMDTCWQSQAYVNHRTCHRDDWGCVGGIVPRAHK